MSVRFAILVLSLHVIWSITAPVAVAEAAFPGHGQVRPRPWFGGAHHIVFSLVCVAMGLVIRAGHVGRDDLPYLHGALGLAAPVATARSECPG